MLSINRGPLLKRKITTVWQKKKQTSTIKQKNTIDLGMEQEHKNQDHQEKYFSGIFHALHRLVTKSGENRNSLVKILWCDIQAVLNNKQKNIKNTNCLGRKRVGGVYKLLTKSPHFKITRPAYPPLLSIGLAQRFVSNFK